MRIPAVLGAALLLGCNALPGAPIPDDSGIDATTIADAGTQDANDAAPADARRDGCTAGETVADAGDTCAGFGTGTSCDPACGLPPYGYVCTNGGPPGFAGCVRVSNSPLLGGTYCCPDLKCVRVVAQDGVCADAGLAPRLYQCATEADGGLLATPAPGCMEVSGLPAYRYFCCAS